VCTKVTAYGKFEGKTGFSERVPEPALNRSARTLLDLRLTSESTTKEERKDLVHIMIQEVGVDVVSKRVYG
jgi:hypothetical protein